MGKLNAIKVKTLGPGRHSDGEGLHLLVKESGSRSWMLRIQSDGKRRDLGLGSVETSGRMKEQQEGAEKISDLQRRVLTLAEARDKADAYRKMIKAGIDPIAERYKTAVARPTFEEASRACHLEMKAGWRNKKHIESWLASLEGHVFPMIGSKPIDSINSIVVRDVLAPIWLKVPETARRILQRIGVVLDFAHIKGWRPEETSLRSVPKGLPRQPRRDRHFESMPYGEVPSYMQRLAAAQPTAGRDALQLTVLTAVRSNETRFAMRDEFDLEVGTWTIPAARMKMNEIHIVPLNSSALQIVKRRFNVMAPSDQFVFFAKSGKPISDMTMTKVLRDDGIAKITVHGFRSSFTDWAAETTDIPKEVIDKSLAHRLPDKVEAAYRRTDFFEKRRKIMDAWDVFLTRQL